ncbi:MAG: GNAT family N-acetyltransferase [Brevinemataceae bacterium]
MENMIVVRMEEHMIEKGVDLFISVFSREPWNDVYESRDQVKEFFQKHFSNNYFLGYAVYMDEEVKGLSLGVKKACIKGMEYYIEEFCIEYDLQGKGIGSKFLKGIETAIKDEGLNGIVLNADKNLTAFEFYKSNGFMEFRELVIMGKMI